MKTPSMMMMRKKISSAIALFLVWISGAVAQNGTGSSNTLANSLSEPYVYVIYYLDPVCHKYPVSIIGFVSNDDAILYGGRAIHDQGIAPACSIESSCLIDQYSPQCQGLNRTKVGVTTFSVSQGGLIYQCDTTNVDGQCSILDQCYGSSVYPDCYFQVALTSELTNNASLITNPHPEAEIYHEQAYMLFYSDVSCQMLEGIQGVMAGTNNELVMTDTTIFCQHSMVCLFNPTGKACSELLAGQTMQNYTIVFETINNGTDVAVCHEGTQTASTASTGSSTITSNGTTCTNIITSSTGGKCQASPIYPSCYYKWASGVQLFKDPTLFLGEPQPESHYLNSNGSSSNNYSSSGNGGSGGGKGGGGASSSTLSGRAIVTKKWTMGIAGIMVGFTMISFVI